MIRIPTLKGVLVIALLMWPTFVQANIGDDITILRKRYGSAKDMANQMLFQHDGYSICVYFDGNVAAMEVFVRDGSKPDKLDITPDDITQILDKEGEGMPWNPVVSKTGEQTWLRSDHKLIARLTESKESTDKYLTVMVNTN